MKKALILLAGGKGCRFDKTNKSIPKQFKKNNNYNLIEFFLKNLDPNLFNRILIVIKNSDKKKYLKQLNKEFPMHNIKFVKSGNTRQQSSNNGVLSLQDFNPKKVLIHDSARPLTSNKLIKRILKNLDKNDSCSPYVINNDLIKASTKKNINYGLKIQHIQTPQGFIFKKILKAHKISKINSYKDDTTLISSIGVKTKLIKGEKINFKITYKEDYDIFKNLIQNEFRHGIGYDIHKLNFRSKKMLKLCGVKIKYFPLIGHSDADAGFHAICDSILGALSMRDIGYYFNDKNIKWKNANSSIFMKFCKKQLDNKRYKIVNLDLNFICEKPKIYSYINKMKNNISKLLDLNKKCISIKATTNEKIGFIGKGEGIAAESIIQIRSE